MSMQTNNLILKRSLLLALLLALLTTTFATYAEVFRQVDKDGNVTYSDVPSKAKQKPVTVTPMTTFKAPVSKRPISDNKSKAKPKVTKYQSLTVQEPAENSVIRANDGNISVAVESTPELDTDAGHKIIILIDGSPAKRNEADPKIVAGVSRGEHSISAQIIDDKEQVLITSTNTVKINVLRASVNSPARKGKN